MPPNPHTILVHAGTVTSQTLIYMGEAAIDAVYATVDVSAFLAAGDSVEFVASASQ